MDPEAFAARGGPELHPCQSCGRKFYPESLERHEKICRNHQLKDKKRRVFDSGKQRSQGSTKTTKLDAPQQSGVKVTNWRQNHLDFVNAIRSARDAQKAIRTGGPLPPPPPPSVNPNYVPCPYCNRRFNAKAGARHITFCQQRTKTYGEPIKSLSKRAAADVGGSKTGRGKAYYQRVIRTKEVVPSQPLYSGVPVYSSAFSGSYSANNLNNYSSQLVAAPPKSFRPTTSPRRKIVSVSATTSRNSTPLSSYSNPSPNNNSRHSIGRPVSGALKKYPRNRTPKGNVRFSDEVETFHMPPSPDGSMKDVENVAVVPPNQAMNPTRPHGNDFVSHYGSQEHLRSPPHAPRTPAGISRERMRKDNLQSQADNTQYEMTTSLGLASTSLNSSGYSSDPSSPVSPPGYQSPRLQAAGDNSSSYQNGVVFGQRSTTPQIMRETSMVKRENSVLAPFCHDCGTQYPTSTSKFCCSCGIQRAFISPR